MDFHLRGNSCSSRLSTTARSLVALISHMASSPSAGGKCQNSNSPNQRSGLRSQSNGTTISAKLIPASRGRSPRSDGRRNVAYRRVCAFQAMARIGSDSPALHSRRAHRSRAGSRHCHAASISMARGGIAASSKLAAPDSGSARCPAGARPSQAVSCLWLSNRCRSPRRT